MKDEEYLVLYEVIRGQGRIVVGKKGTDTRLYYSVYSVKGEPDTIKKNYFQLIAVMQLVGETKLEGNYVKAGMDRESILAVVPEWEKVI